MSDCSAAWTLIKSRRWTVWHGLPTCPLDAWQARFPTLSKDHGTGKLGDARAPAEIRRLTLPDYDRPLEVWSRDGKVVLVAIEYPGDDPELRALDQALGNPSTRLDWAQRTLVYTEAARVYADRGIALLTSADGGTILRVNLFAAADATGYAATLHHPARPMRRLPPRR